jgi:hypothetical protein
MIERPHWNVRKDIIEKVSHRPYMSTIARRNDESRSGFSLTLYTIKTFLK